VRDSRTFEGRVSLGYAGCHRVGDGSPAWWVEQVVSKAAGAQQGARPVRVFVTVEVEEVATCSNG
jgi:hypothetical protein